MKFASASRTVSVLLVMLFAACDRAELAPEVQPEGEGEAAVGTTAFSGGSVTIHSAADTFALGVEVADTEAERNQGLMERQSLAADSGMVFIFEQPQPATGVFWMYKTRIPLSIAFIGADGIIGSIVEMEPCTSEFPQWCPNYEAGVPFQSALEANAGYFAANGIEVGDHVVLEQR